MAVFMLAGDEELALLRNAMKQWHPELGKAGVEVGLSVAMAQVDESGNPTGPALQEKGHAVLAEVKITKLRERIFGLPDAIITIDGDRWTHLEEATKLAVLDHELEHLVVKTDENGRPAVDDSGRPLLKMKLHDFQFGWFNNVAQRHGGAAIEVMQASTIAREWGQMYLPGFQIVPQPASEMLRQALERMGDMTMPWVAGEDITVSVELDGESLGKVKRKRGRS